MNEEKIKEIVNQVLFNPQVIPPPVSYKITDVNNGDPNKSYSSEYMDAEDFKSYLKRLQAQLVYRLTEAL